MPESTSALIIDGYVDEPACLGVAPYVSPPYIREVAGVLAGHGYAARYVTIDQVRPILLLLPAPPAAAISW